jgi:hypothetical protein
MSHKVFKFLRSLRDNVSRKYYHVNQAKSAVRPSIHNWIYADHADRQI